MDISKLKENTLAALVQYRGHVINCEFKPDLLSAEDGKLTVAEYVAKGLVSWDVTENGEPVEISAESLATRIPDGLLTVLWDELLSMREAGMGKRKVLGK